MLGGQDLKLLPHVVLHDVHFVGRGATAGTFANPTSSQPALTEQRSGLKPLQFRNAVRKCRKDGLNDVLQDVIAGSSSQIANVIEQANPHQVFLSSTCIVVDTGDGGCLSIPLQFTDLVEAVLPTSQGASYVVALAPRPGLAGHLQCDSSSQSNPPLQDVWAFMVSCDSLELKRLFFDLGGRGAVRWDLLECYELARRPFGEGGCGRVYLGQSVIAKKFKKSCQIVGTLGQDVVCIDEVAVKFLNAQTEEETTRREMDFLIRARGHPNIISVHGIFCDFDRRTEVQGNTEGDRTSWFIAMELCSSGDLFDHVAGGVLNNKECGALMTGLSSALQHLHQLRIAHRDVKPENILLGTHSQPILADMGVASHLDDAIEMAKLHGSPGYAAPEILENKRYNELVDIFSAGCVYYFALSFRQPFRGIDKYDTLKRTVACNVRYPHRYFHNVPLRIMNLTKLCLSKDPKNRPCARQCIESISGDATVRLEQNPYVTVSTSCIDGAGSEEQHSSGETRASQAGTPTLCRTDKAEPEAALVESPLPPIVLPSTPDEPASASQRLLPEESRLQPAARLVPASSSTQAKTDAFHSLLPTQATSPRFTERKKMAQRSGSIPSRIKRCLMPSAASQWIAGAFRSKTSSRVVDDPGSSSSSSGAGPAPPSSAVPSKKLFRRFSLRRPKVMGM